MTYEEAAKILDGQYVGMCAPQEVCEAIELAARVLRSVASASADAEKGCHEWTMAHRLDPDVDIADAYLAGHAALQAEVEALRAELRDLGITNDCLKIHTKALEADLAAMCGEVERMDDHLKKAHYSAWMNIRPDRLPRVTEILAARKEKHHGS